MTIHRFFIPSGLFSKGKVNIRGNEAYHLIKILRAHSGDEIRIFNEKGNEFHCKIASIRGKEAVAEIVERVETVVEPPITINIAQALVKSGKMDLIIQKCTEIGAAAFYPLITAFSVSKPNQPEKQLMRWDRIALEATKQSERRSIPAVYDIQPLEEFIKDRGDDALIYMDARIGSSLKPVFEFFKKKSKTNKFTVLVGPEGGFSPEEKERLKERDCQSVRLGPRILRTETAAAVMTSLLLYEFGDMS
jgi:16S rRNA (uracil1498-N3)-methyltransferase